MWHFLFGLHAVFGAVQVVSAAAMGALLRFIVAVVTPPVVVAFIVASLDDLALALANPPDQPAKPQGPLLPGWADSSASLWNFAHSMLTSLIPTVFAICLSVWMAGFRWRRAGDSPGRIESALTRIGCVDLPAIRQPRAGRVCGVADGGAIATRARCPHRGRSGKVTRVGLHRRGRPTERQSFARPRGRSSARFRRRQSMTTPARCIAVVMSSKSISP